MVVRKHRKTYLADGRKLQAVLNERKDIVLGKHNALSDTRGARGIDEHLHLLKVVVLHFEEGLIAVFEELFTLLEEFVEGKIFAFVLFTVEADEIFNVGNLVTDTLERFLALFIAEDDIVIAVIDDVYKVRIGKLLVDRTENALALKRRKINENPIVAVFACAGNVSLSKAERIDSGAEPENFFLKFLIANLTHALARCTEFISNLVARFAYCVCNKVLNVANGGELGRILSDRVSHHNHISPDFKKIIIITKNIISGFENYVNRFFELFFPFPFFFYWFD